MAASVSELLREIAELEEPLEELRSLKTVVYSLPLTALRDLAVGLRFGVLFALLDNNDDREQIDTSVAILDRLLQALDPVYLAENFKVELQKGLQHSDDNVKILAMSQIGRIVENANAMPLILGSPELLKEMIRSIGGKKISVAKEAIKSLSKVSQSKAGLDALFMTSMLQDLKDVMAINDVVRYRIYELVVEISSVSPVSLDYCANSGLISQLLAELIGDDVLIRATAIEMVTGLAQSQHGRQYLAQQGTIDRISNMIIGAESDPFSGFYLPNLVKFFGNLAMVDSPQQVCERYPAFIEKVFEMIEGQEPTMIGVGLDTIGILGSCVEGKQVLHKTGSKFQEVLRRLGSISCNASTDLRVRCLDTIASLLSLSNDQQTEDLLGMTESWFHTLHSHPMETFCNMNSQPFPEIHISSLKIFTAIASQPWGQRLMISTPGFVEYIVDRSAEPDKSSKDAKFELVKTLVDSKTTAEIFGNQYYLQLRAYLREGPYFVKAVATVAVDGE
ncbi:26S proteasome non-ATPase regulatory subunit 5 isoform X2 [Rhincodon typus]|uniref:26S proteasome non-ATPase regulatory subunit 5 isoform X2 n=1 Tax=Rhincodon typus TaxID=259920 RepID=UPI00202E7001|nr:26S proteasome non-ATPase regulatory subunit 5 isoform X2 [Rhincodon typus]